MELPELIFATIFDYHFKLSSVIVDSVSAEPCIFTSSLFVKSIIRRFNTTNSKVAFSSLAR